MELGRCPRCSEGYTASQVAGLGILRAREARAGGPRVEYQCHACGRQIHLIPHGDGRYAPPGQPPPQFVPEADRRPPWVGDAASARPGGRPPREEAPPGPPPASADNAESWETPASETAEAAAIEEVPLSTVEALALLGCAVTAERPDIERAFRERSLTCHPDKVAHLDPEFQELAERKFKRLRAAYDLLIS